MPKQAVFFEQESGDRRVEVLKPYDQQYAREVFASMDENAIQKLWDSLKPEEIYDLAGLPKLNDPADVDGEAESFLWDELLEQAREDGNLLSFFIVNETVKLRTESVYVSPDWPSAEAYAQDRLRRQP